MLTGHMRAGTVAVFAVIFGALQLICACLPAMNTASSMTAQMSVVSEYNSHSNMSMGHGMALTPPPAQHDHDQHDHEADCSHCSAATILSATLDQAPAGVVSVQSKKTIDAIKIVSAWPRAKMAATNLAALRWLDPPLQSPVTLKIRLLT